MQQRGAKAVTLIEGGRGMFEIRDQGVVLYSKQKTGRFPTDAELDALFAGC